MKKLRTALISVLFAMLMPSAAFAWGSHLIGLDPGHGGSDPGASGPSAPHEAELCLRAATQVRNWIVNQMGGKCNMTRTSNVDVSLTARRDYSVAWDTWIFCSFHLNAFNGSAHGTETWYYWTTGNSYNLAAKVQAQLVSQLGRANRGVKQNGWTVITGHSNVPAILTESLFVDNYDEWNMINNESKDGFKKWCRGHIYGFYDYFRGVHGINCADPRNNSVINGTPAASLNVSTGSVGFNCYRKAHPTQQFTVTGTSLSNDIIVSSNNAAFTVNGSNSVNIGKTGGTVTVRLASSDNNGSASGTITIASGSLRKTVSVSANITEHPVQSMHEVWNFSEQKGNKNEKGYDASKISNFCYNDGKLFCVYDHNSIKVLNAATGEDLGNLYEGDICNGGEYKFSDVKCLDGVIVACNYAKAGSELRLYAWDNWQLDPYLLLSTTDFQGATELGECMEMVGTYASDAWFAFGNDNGSTTRIVEYHRQSGAWSAKNTVVLKDGAQLKTGSHTRGYPKGSGWWVDGNDSYPHWTAWDDASQATTARCYVNTGDMLGGSHHEFRFKGHKYAVNVKFNNGLKGRLGLCFDNAGNFSDALYLNDYPAEGLGSNTRNTSGAGDVIVQTDENNYIHAWVFTENHGIACYAYGDNPSGSYVGPLKPAEKWNFSEKRGNQTELGWDTKKINNIAYGAGKLYCVYDHSAIKVLDAQTGKYLGDLPLGNVVNGGTYALSDVEYIDGKVVACNYAVAGQELKFYWWWNDCVEPSLLYSTTDLQGAPALGDCFEVNKNAKFSESVYFAFVKDDGAASRLVEYERKSDGTWAVAMRKFTTDGSTRLPLGKYARVYPWGGTFWLDGCDALPSYMSFNNDINFSRNCDVNIPTTWGACHHEINWNGKKYSINLNFDDKRNGRGRLTIDNTGNYSSITPRAEFPADGLGNSQNTSGAADIDIKTDGSTYFEAWVFSENQGVAYYAYGNPPRVEPSSVGELKLDEKWNISAQKGNIKSMGWDASKIRNFAYQDGKIYFVYDSKVIKVINAQTGEYLGDLNDGGVIAGGEEILSDVKCFDGRIIACNRVVSGQELRFYAWNKDTEPAYVLYKTTNLGTAPALGESFEIAPDSQWETFFWINSAYDDGSKTHVIEYHQSAADTWEVISHTLTTDGTNYYHLGKNARVYPHAGKWWICGNDAMPAYGGFHTGMSNVISRSFTHNIASTWGAAHHQFTYCGHVYAYTPEFDANHQRGRIRIDYLGNLEYTVVNPRGTYPAEGLGNTDCTRGYADAIVNTDGSTYVEAWVFAENQGIAYFTEGNVPKRNPQKISSIVRAEEGTANPYAYNLYSSIDIFDFAAHYTLNADAQSVDIVIYDEESGAEAMTVNLGAQSAGIHEEHFDVQSLENDHTYSWAVRVNGNERILPETFGSKRFYHARGVDVDNNMESESFGNIYCTEGKLTTDATYISGNGGGPGLYAFDASLNPIENSATGGYAFMGGLTFDDMAGDKSGADPARVRVADDGRIFITRCNDSGSYIAYTPSFTDLAANNTFHTLLSGGTNDAANCIYNDASSNFLAAANVGIDVKGSGDELQLLALSGSKALFNFNQTASRVDCYNLGNADALPSPAPVSALSGKYTVNAVSANVDFDNRGGIWYCQYRIAPTDGEPSLVYVDANGVERYKDITTVRGAGAVRVSPDGTMLAAPSSEKAITIYSIAYDEAGTPSLTEILTMYHGVGRNVNDIAWDVAGNIYICDSYAEYLKAFSLPRPATTVETKAQSKYSFLKLITGVDSINAETKAEAEYFNTLGIKVNPEYLTPGIYLRRTGKKIEKIIVK